MLERSKVVLETGESVLRRERCTTKITQAFLRHERYWYWPQLPRGPMGRMRESRKEVKGELVLTNKRLIFLGEKGRIRKKVVPFLELDLKKITEAGVKTSEKGENLMVSLDLGGMKPWELEFSLIGAAEWVDVVKKYAGVATSPAI